MTNEFKEYYKLFVDTWGEDAQITQAIEEMSELTKELCKLRRYVNNTEKQAKIKEDVIEEIADVINMAEQLAFIFGEDKVKEIRNKKIKRTVDEIIKGGSK